MLEIPLFVFKLSCPAKYNFLKASLLFLYAKPGTPGAQDSGYLCRNIYENLQHSDLFDFRQNDKGTWYIKPVMKIPSNTSPLTRVVRIEVIPFGDAIPVRTIEIKAENFKDSNGYYGGNYVESYIGLSSLQKLEISGYTNSTDLNYKRNLFEWWDWDANCKVDFRVFWYGDCSFSALKSGNLFFKI